LRLYVGDLALNFLGASNRVRVDANVASDFGCDYHFFSPPIYTVGQGALALKALTQPFFGANYIFAPKCG
jgi:hypothetical protein